MNAGMGPIGVAKHLSQFLPKHRFAESGSKNGIGVRHREGRARERERVCVCVCV